MTATKSPRSAYESRVWTLYEALTLAKLDRRDSSDPAERARLTVEIERLRGELQAMKE